MTLEAAPDDFSESEKREWAQPGTATRLKRIAFHIAGNIPLHASRSDHSVAVNEWKDDLTWLKKTLYNTSSMSFQWPQTFV